MSTWENSGVARNVDDAATQAVAVHVPDRVLTAEEGGFDIGVEAGVPVLFRDVFDLLDHADTGVVHQNVDPAGKRCSVIHQLFQLAFGADIADMLLDSEGFKRLVILTQQRIIGDNHLGTGFGQRGGGCSTDTAGPSGNDGDSVCEVGCVHV